MRDADKPFVMYRRSRWNFNIVPRGTRGWVQLGIWLVLLVPPTIAFEAYADTHEGTREFYVALGLYVLMAVIWSLALIRWTMARAEVIDIEKLLREQRKSEAKPRRGR
ncbi:hypothetical protein [Porphyrobacter sp. YT40]|uniref:hypothetical protein n=1 Tax=Porphyrobacter sp. YT40 TaxID=2547601 RepID=UPI0011424F06|nr:hypothetical protein [Porphyrobacter sp. YT40]QDH33030.1 hypothetical protein E2E27_00975 [Porphyrobacter sp. YT40]